MFEIRDFAISKHSLSTFPSTNCGLNLLWKLLIIFFNSFFFKLFTEYPNLFNCSKKTLLLILKYLPLNIFIDLLHNEDIIATTFGTQVFINEIVNLYGAKKFYFSDSEYTIFDNVSTGLSISNDRFQLNFGVQLLSAFNISYGTSLLMKFK